MISTNLFRVALFADFVTTLTLFCILRSCHNTFKYLFFDYLILFLHALSKLTLTLRRSILAFITLKGSVLLLNISQLHQQLKFAYKQYLQTIVNNSKLLFTFFCLKHRNAVKTSYFQYNSLNSKDFLGYRKSSVIALSSHFECTFTQFLTVAKLNRNCTHSIFNVFSKLHSKFCKLQKK